MSFFYVFSSDRHDKKKELQDFIERFSANASKSKQATARKKMLAKIDVDEIKPSSRKYPGIIWEQEREAGDQILEVDKLNSSSEEGKLLNNLSFRMSKGDKIMFYSKAFFDMPNENHAESLRNRMLSMLEW